MEKENFLEDKNLLTSDVIATLYKFEKLILTVRKTGHIQVSLRFQQQEAGFRALVYDYTNFKGHIIHRTPDHLVLYWDQGEIEYIPKDRIEEVTQWLRENAREYMPKSYILKPVLDDGSSMKVGEDTLKITKSEEVMPTVDQTVKKVSNNETTSENSINQEEAKTNSQETKSSSNNEASSEDSNIREEKPREIVETNLEQAQNKQIETQETNETGKLPENRLSEDFRPAFMHTSLVKSVSVNEIFAAERKARKDRMSKKRNEGDNNA